MTRARFALFLLSFSVLPLAAQSADLSVTMAVNKYGFPPPPPGDALPVGWEVSYHVRFNWSAAEAARNVVIEIDAPGEISSVWDGQDAPYHCIEPITRPIRCTVDADLTSFTGEIHVFTKLSSPGLQVATARIMSTTPDPNEANNIASVSIDVRNGPALTPSIDVQERVEPGGNSLFYAYVRNVGQPAKDLTFTLTLPDGGKFVNVSVDAVCDIQPDRVVCTRPSLTSDEFRLQILVQYTAPERFDGGPMRVVLTASSAEADIQPADDSVTAELPLIRYFFVTSTADDGGGTLRQALLESRMHCGKHPCTIAFRIPATEARDGVFTIRPQTSLPKVRGFVKIDGATQKAFGGDTNPAGPEIELQGSALGPGAHGLLLGEGCEIQVLDLAINGFPSPAIETQRTMRMADCIRTIFPNTLIARNYLGTDARGVNVVPNFRGVAVVRSAYVSIDENLIRGNLRAGVFVDGTGYTGITRNRIVDNGASGVFIDSGNERVFGSVILGADVTENVIARNAEWGVARTGAGDVSVRRNSIFDNRHLAIDVGLDLETPNRANDDSGVPNKPVLFSAAYDAATGKTVIRGRVDTTSWFWTVKAVDVYGSSVGVAQAEAWLGTLDRGNGVPSGDFTMEVAGDWRGKAMTATYTRGFQVGFLRDPGPGTNSHLHDVPTNTSEISNTVFVH